MHCYPLYTIYRVLHSPGDPSGKESQLAMQEIQETQV